MPSDATHEAPVTLLEERTILEGYWYPDVLFAGDKIILEGVAGDYDVIGSAASSQYVERQIVLSSLDSGVSWERVDEVSVTTRNVHVAREGEEPYYITSLDPTKLLFRDRCILSDGSYMGVLGNIVNDKIRVEQNYKPVVVLVRRAPSAAALLAGDYYDDFSRVSIPNLSGCFGDDRNYNAATTHHALVELHDGSLLMSMQGTFYDDTTVIPYSPNRGAQYRSWLATSLDRGNSWSYLSTIASSDVCSLPVISQGFCEPDVIRLADGHLLAVMRTGGDPTPEGGFDRYTPLFQARSKDNGLTWYERKPICTYGVMPRLLRMSDGTLICASGRPGVFFVISDDDGDTWSEPISVTEKHGRYRECPSGYTSIGEVERGVLSVYYDDVLVADDGTKTFVTKLRNYRIAST